MAALVLFVAAAFFGHLAVDAHRMGQPFYETPYEIEAKARGEAVEGVSPAEQRKRRRWHLQYGIGTVRDVVWLWSILAASCFAAALSEVTVDPFRNSWQLLKPSCVVSVVDKYWVRSMVPELPDETPAKAAQSVAASPPAP